VAQANAGARDLTGICLFDEQEVVRYVRPARGSRSLVQLLNVLADAAGLAPATGEARITTLLPMAYAFAQEVYPYLLQPDLNHIPSWSAWFWPVPTYPSHPLSLRRHIFRGLVLLLASLPLLSTGLLLYVFSDVFAALAEAFVPVPESLRGIIGIALAASLLLGYYSGVLFVYRSLGLWLSPKRRRLARWRKRLAAILAERYGLAPGGLAFLLENDQPFSLCMQRFLAEHQVPYPLPLYDRSGRYLFASPGKINVLARALVHAVGKGHDNELFVLLVDLLELVDRLEPLLGAVKMTLARHHRVLVICPWPPGVPPPLSRESAERGARGAERQGHDEVVTHAGHVVPSVALRAPRSALRAPALVQQATVNRLHRAFARLQAAFIRLGVPVICADSADPVRLILDRLDRLRALGVGGRR
jgi:hypothetical protein